MACGICGDRCHICSCKSNAKRDGEDFDKLVEKVKREETRQRGYPFSDYDNVKDYPRGW